MAHISIPIVMASFTTAIGSVKALEKPSLRTSCHAMPNHQFNTKPNPPRPTQPNPNPT